ncbi:CRISP-associated protein Cas1 [Candidatus Hakubella thermalkaliphila]|uniref:CRISPR-associated endonuclease Cas1 n=1 Tax=Candidatus Hakubella thermalkaliphila TaxID=2754717 RepID=A0A6V8PSM7_9ACTN|nr:type I-C CRISPR-associated endonuclease Cas1c [Candidatus Hakubella thermalkaliphila]MBT9167729.1 CRISPR-associated endonuclease Cas1 [Bacillota bacterium]GFP21255.1 CRISP-associated protein Cas1 [Candidatus Hakubella thermalkaliphila]GFP27756.1 CRISP-associated protein Cas1 [Candidatus Hakubella thermalkaliphila]GFP35110.1 CRISP-associated protein Cas1 [Candidatus Hakubella thermalkaliphila]GFP41588.1 CRISP-associated protein Cas1 [Candidatus Hakubella thermalkaliphila]
MKRLLNILYVTTQGAYLHREGETAVVTLDGERKLRVPIHTLQDIVCFGQVSMSPPLMGLCAERGVAVSFLSQNGRFLARVQGPVSGNVLLRRKQYRRADNLEESAEIARAVVIAKLNNSRVVLLRAVRGYPESAGAGKLAETASHLTELLKVLESPQSLDTVRGVEGEAARKYFEVFDHLILAQKEDFFFKERSRRPPLDSMNALLSFLYTLLAHDVASALETVGLDPAVGYLHRDRPGRPGLALDIMEEFRPFLADRLALSLVNLKQITGKGFKKTETGAVVMNDETRKEVIVAYQNRKQEEITHPFLKEKMDIGLLPYAQALLLARYLRGDMEGYPPFLWR